MKKIILTQGMFVVVDNEDYEWLAQWKWYAKNNSGKWYAARGVYNKNKRNMQTYFMQHHILRVQQSRGLVIDHINLDTLDNQKCNLRICTHQQNCFNRPPNKNSTSQYKGVCWHKRDGVWRACIRKNGKSIHIGSYKSESEAACAYNEYAKELFGEFAFINLVKAGLD